MCDGPYWNHSYLFRGCGLPRIFDPKPCSYPPTCEKCAGPSCSNPYRYRDSKTKVPLCQLMQERGC